MEIKDALDFKDPGPQIVAKGRLHRITIECYAPDSATPEQIEAFIKNELGFGGIGPDNPLYDGAFEVRYVEHERDMGVNGYTIWNAEGEDGKPGSRTGKVIHRRPGEPLVVEYQQPNERS